MPETRTTDAEEAAAFRAAGARLMRHGHDLVLDLVPVSPAPDWDNLTLPGSL